MVKVLFWYRMNAQVITWIETMITARTLKSPQENLWRNFAMKQVSTSFYLSGLCIPANNTLFIVGISEKLAAREPQLTLEVREG